ncbi:MAG: DUF2203 domain-containing protein [Candidatus Dormiibacterota bacterium]
MRIRTFSVEEANRALPQVRRYAERIVTLGRQLSELQDDLQVATYRSGRSDATQGDEAAVRAATAALREVEEGFLDALHGLETIGVELKDPRQGLVDFPSVRENVIVELCWRLGEDRISYWHPTGAGHDPRHSLSSGG